MRRGRRCGSASRADGGTPRDRAGCRGPGTRRWRGGGREVLGPADWDRMIATNLTGAYNLVHFVLPTMRARGRGLVVQVASVAGLRASVLGGAAYSASKFGQAALGICLGREERSRG